MLLAGWVGSHLGALIPPPGGLEWESQSSSVSCSPLSRRKYSRVVNIWGFVVKVGFFFFSLRNGTSQGEGKEGRTGHQPRPSGG